MFRDEFGLIVQRDGDGGDTLQREGMYAFAASFPEAHDHADMPGHSMMVLGIATSELYKDGILIRNPIRWNDPNDVSRDQQDAFVIAMGASGNLNFVRAIMKRHLKRFGKYQNADIANLSTVALYLRALNQIISYPFLFFFDLGLVFSSVQIALDKNPDHVDDNNHLMRLMQAKTRMPTFVSDMAWRLYFKYRPWNYGCMESASKVDDKIVATGNMRVYHPVIGALRWYHRAESGGNPEFAEFYKAILYSKWPEAFKK